MPRNNELRKEEANRKGRNETKKRKKWMRKK